MSNTLLLIDKDRDYIKALSVFLERLLFDVYLSTTSSEVLHMVDFHTPKYIVGDPDFQDTDGINLFLNIKSKFPETLFIILTQKDRIDDIMCNMRLNAFAFITKPVNSTELELNLLRAKEWHKNQKKIQHYAEKLGSLHKATSLYQQLFEQVPCYITVQNKHYRITATNNLFKKHFGDAVGEYCYKAYKHREKPCVECPVVKTFQDGKFHTTEEVVTSKNGQQYNVITWTAPIHEDDKKITQVIEMSANITQIRQLQNHLESLGMMLGSMSHGVKGMLTALDGGIYQLESGLKRNDISRIEKASTVIQEMGERIKRMVLDILYYAKSREMNHQKIDINQFVNGIIDTIKPLAKKNNVIFKSSFHENMGIFEIDSHWFHAAVVNILENSIDACSSEDNTCDSDYTVQLNVSQVMNENIQFQVKDNGVGINQETKEKMFTLFFSSKGSKGTGLGLFISNHVAKEHGGKIKVESELGKGSVFTITIPRIQRSKKQNNDFYMLNVDK